MEPEIIYLMISLIAILCLIALLLCSMITSNLYKMLFLDAREKYYKLLGLSEQEIKEQIDKNKKIFK